MKRKPRKKDWKPRLPGKKKQEEREINRRVHAKLYGPREDDFPTESEFMRL